MLRSGDQIELSNAQDQPRDSVQMIRWLPGNRSTIFACGGWDGKLRIYEVTKKSYGNSAQIEQRCVVNVQIPIICLEWVGDKQLYVGTVDSRILEVDVSNGKIGEFAKPSSPVQEIKLFDDRDSPAVLFFHLDDRLTVYFPKNTSNKVMDVKFAARITAADLVKDVVVVCFDNCKILVCRVKDLEKTNQNYVDSPLGKESKLNHASLKHDASGFVVSTVDGRVCYMTISGSSYSNTLGTKSEIVFRAFKAVASNSQSKPDIMNMATSMQFCYNSVNYDCFMSTSSGGELKVWDVASRQDQISYDTEKNCDISAARANQDFSLIAFAVGYSWNMGITGLAKVNFSPKVSVFAIDEGTLGRRR